MIRHKPNCTLADAQPMGFVQQSDFRTTMEIVWSCLGIVILSTWSILHPNVPPDFQRQNFVQFVLLKLYLIARKALWMLVMFVAPEALTSLYAHKMFTSRQNYRALNEEATKQGVPWSRTHTVFADMGGFAIRFPTKKQVRLEDPPPRNEKEGATVEVTSVPDEPKSMLKGYLKKLLETIKEDMSAARQRFKKFLLSDRRRFIDDFDLKQRVFFGWFGQIPWERHEKFETYAQLTEPTLHSRLRSSDGSIQSDGNEIELDLHWKLQNLAALSGSVWVLDSRQLLIAVEMDVIKLPNITEKEIKDKSKSDVLVKFLAIMQILWLVIQLAARKYGKLASTPLEVSTVALSVSAIILYIIEWNKPQDVSTPVYINGDEEKVFPGTLKELVEGAPYPYLRFPIIPTKGYHIPSCAFHMVIDKGSYSQIWLETTVVSVTSILLFGGVHLLAWNFTFPTATEKTLWRVCSIAGTVLPLPYLATHIPLIVRYYNNSRKTAHMVRWFQGLIALLYVLVRLFLITESFRSLYYLSQKAFRSTWSINFPHWG